MSKKDLPIILLIIIILAIVIVIEFSNHENYNKFSYEILSYDEVPEFIKDKIDASITPYSDLNFIIESGEQYIVIEPPDNKSIEILSVEKDANYFCGIICTYKYVDKITVKNHNVLDNLKIVKINNFNGSVTCSLVNN